MCSKLAVISLSILIFFSFAHILGASDFSKRVCIFNDYSFGLKATENYIILTDVSHFSIQFPVSSKSKEGERNV